MGFIVKEVCESVYVHVHVCVSVSIAINYPYISKTINVFAFSYF